jgi:hypothetical protein
MDWLGTLYSASWSSNLLARMKSKKLSMCDLSGALAEEFQGLPQ